MKKHCVRIMSAFFGLAALAFTIKAEEVDRIVVNVPYEFVVDGTTLPAGRYIVNPISNQNKNVLVISNSEGHAAILVLSSEIAGTSSGAAQPSVSFQQVGEQHLLSKIQTAEHVFTIPVKESGK